MKWTTRSLIELLTILVVGAVVIILAVLQYRWTGSISQTEEQRLRVGLDTSVGNFNQEFTYEFERLCEGFEVDPQAPASTIAERLQRQYLDWTQQVAQPALVAGVYLARWDGLGEIGASRWQALDVLHVKFVDVAWPAELEALRGPLQSQLAQLSPSTGDRQALYYPWTMYADLPALVRPLFQISSNAAADRMEARPIGFVVVELDGVFLRQEYLPGMVERYFGSLGLENFGVAVRNAGAPYTPLYLSETSFPISVSKPDAKLDLFASVADAARRRGHAPLEPSRAGEQWELAVQHPAGSVELGVTAWRRRSLAISFGLLGVLVASTVMVMSVARRADRLAKMQMEFVAGVSHELCTPLAVINSASENLVDGVVDDPAQTREYGAMIRDQGRRLEHLVDQVLVFAGGKFERSGYDLRPVEIGPLLARSIASAEPMLREAGFAVEQEIGTNLPRVVADPTAVGTCIENLVSNAVKYAGDTRWIAVRAHANGFGNRSEVEVTVEDKGVGISQEDMGHVFEPFYRVQSAREGQIRGMGLGLYLVKRTMEGMGGRVSVTSAAGRGSRFSLFFPVADGTAG